MASIKIKVVSLFVGFIRETTSIADPGRLRELPGKAYCFAIFANEKVITSEFSEPFAGSAIVRTKFIELNDSVVLKT